MIKKSKTDSGQAIVELAFVLPFIVILMLGLIEFGILFYDKAMVTNASREGARAGMTYTSDSSGNYWSEATMRTAAQTAVNQYLQAKLINFGGAGTINTVAVRTGGSPGDPDNPGNNITGGTVDVTVTYTHTYLAIPKFGGWGGNTINIGARTIMRLE